MDAEALRALAPRVPRDARGLLRSAGPVPLPPLATLVGLALDEDHPGGLLAAAAAELGRPLGLAALAGPTHAHAPDDAGGRQALAVARRAAHSPGTSPPPGWRVVPVAPSQPRRAVLAVGAGDAGASVDPLLDLVVALLGEQLLRAGLRRSQTAALLRRLVAEPATDIDLAHEQAAALGLVLLDAYWPVVVTWATAAPAPAALDSLDLEAKRLAPGALTAAVKGSMVLLHPGRASAPGLVAWVERLLAYGRTVAPSADARAVAADEPVALGELGAQVARLVRLGGYVVRADAPEQVTWARRHRLAGLLRESVPAVEARTFVDDLLGDLIAWDRDHRGDLVAVLEAALDNPRHDVAAQRCFMHRNTFRHRLHKALEVLGDDLADADMRLAVHVALKLRRAVAVADAGGGGAVAPAAATLRPRAPRSRAPAATRTAARKRPAGAR